MKQARNPDSLKDTTAIYEWLNDNFEHGGKITDSKDTVLKFLKQYTMVQIKDEYEDNMLSFTEQIDQILNQASNDQTYFNNYVSPWDVESLYEFQYFNCPTCSYKHQSAQDFVDHAFNTHPESKNSFINISNHDSFSDILSPWKYESKHSSLKNELNENEEICDESVEKSNLIDDPLGINSEQFIMKSEEYIDNFNEGTVGQKI